MSCPRYGSSSNRNVSGSHGRKHWQCKEHLTVWDWINSTLLNPVVPPSKTSYSVSSLRRPGLTFASVVAKADSGATKHYFRPQDSNILKNLHQIEGGTPVHLPDGSAIQTTHQGNLPLSTELSLTAITVNILPHLRSASLVSLGQLCDDD